MGTYKTFHCRVCKGEIGRTNGAELLIGEAVAVVFKTTFRCQRCGSMVVWRPVAPVTMVAEYKTQDCPA